MHVQTQIPLQSKHIYNTFSLKRTLCLALFPQALQSTLIFCIHFTNVFNEKKARGRFLQIRCLDLERELILKGLKSCLLSYAFARLHPSKSQRPCCPGSRLSAPDAQVPEQLIPEWIQIYSVFYMALLDRIKGEVVFPCYKSFRSSEKLFFPTGEQLSKDVLEAVVCSLLELICCPTEAHTLQEDMLQVVDFSADSTEHCTLTTSLKNAEVMCQCTPEQFLCYRKLDW